MKRDDRAYLLHILEAIQQIEQYVEDLDIKTFIETRLIQDGVIRQLEIIGEATKNVSPTTKNKAPHIPWRDMAGMRDVLIHQYFGVDISAVWDTVKQELPGLKKSIVELI